MSAIVAMIVQVLVQVILAWIKGRISPSMQPAVMVDFEKAYGEAVAQKSAQPLREFLVGLRGA